jgi:hypothetical protein
MTYQTRMLPPEEWSRLKGTEAEPAIPHLDPANTRVVVVEDDGQIVGCWVLVRVVHAEAVWIAPTHRTKFGVVRRLIAGMKTLARGWGAKGVVTAAVSDDVRRLIAKMGGAQLPGEAYVLPVGETCQQRLG